MINLSRLAPKPEWLTGIFTAVLAVTAGVALWIAASQLKESHHEAQVNLARLYLRGYGVPRNCEQAKVLLRAAAKRGSVEARQELEKLRTSGC